MEHDLYAGVSLVLRSPTSRRILDFLSRSERPQTPNMIGKGINVASSNVSTKLKGLRDRNLVECVNPGDKKWRFYTITDDGRRALEESEKHLSPTSD